MAVQRVWDARTERRDCFLWVLRQIIYKWLREARGKGRGLRALASRKERAPRALTPKQEQQIFRWINGKDPRQQALISACGRGDRRKLIADKFEANLGVTAVEITCKIGIDPQKPLKRAYERDPCDRSVEK